MFGFEPQYRLMLQQGEMAFRFATAAAECTAALTRQSLALWSGAAMAMAAPGMGAAPRSIAAGGRSWYRHPAEPSLFEPLSWFTATAWRATAALPWPVAWPSPTLAMPGITSNPVALFGLMAAFSPFAATPAWLPAAALMPFSPASWSLLGPFAAAAGDRGAAATTSPFAAYRSDSGYAVAQILRAGDAAKRGTVPIGMVPEWARLMPWLSWASRP